MKLICDICKKGNKGRYTSKFFELEDGSRKLMTICWECLGEKPTSSKTDKQLFEHISTPFWVHMGLKPNAKEKTKLKYLKDHNMTWGDERRMREANLQRNNPAFEAFQKHKEKYGTRSAPDVTFNKENN